MNDEEIYKRINNLNQNDCQAVLCMIVSGVRLEDAISKVVKEARRKLLISHGDAIIHICHGKELPIPWVVPGADYCCPCGAIFSHTDMETALRKGAVWFDSDGDRIDD